MQSLVHSIEVILQNASNEAKKDQIMEKLKSQVNDSLASVTIFRNMHEHDREHVHAHCLAIAFYLDHYEGRESNINLDKQFFEQ